MQLKLDVKTLVIGIVLGIAIAAAIGASVGSADNADFGLAIQNKGVALVRASDGSLYIIQPPNNEAESVVFKGGRNKGRPFNVRGLGKPKRASAKD